MAFPNTVWGSEEESFKTTTTKRVPLGTKMVGEDGRVYRYCENGGVAQLVASLYQMFVPEADTLEEAVGTMAAGDTVLTGVGATTGSQAADLLVDGYVWSLTAADLNPAYRIKSNTLITAGAATGTITLYNPLEAAIAAATTISYIRNPYKDIIVHPSPATAPVLGWAVKAIAVDAFGWIQSAGVCRALIDGTVVIDDMVRVSEDDDGAVALFDADEAAVADNGPIGHVINIGGDQTKGLIIGRLDN